MRPHHGHHLAMSFHLNESVDLHSGRVFQLTVFLICMFSNFTEVRFAGSCLSLFCVGSDVMFVLPSMAAVLALASVSGGFSLMCLVFHITQL